MRRSCCSGTLAHRLAGGGGACCVCCDDVCCLRHSRVFRPCHLLFPSRFVVIVVSFCLFIFRFFLFIFFVFLGGRADNPGELGRVDGDGAGAGEEGGTLGRHLLGRGRTRENGVFVEWRRVAVDVVCVRCRGCSRRCWCCPYVIEGGALGRHLLGRDCTHEEGFRVLRDPCGVKTV